jgi:PQQ-like domain
MRRYIAVVVALLSISPVATQARFQTQYTHVSGGDVTMAAPGKSTVSVQTPAGDILYLNSNEGAALAEGFRIHKVSKTGSWTTTFSYPGQAGQPKIAPQAMTLDFDGVHAIVVGVYGLSPPAIGPQGLVVMKIRISDGQVTWTKKFESTGTFDIAGFWDGVIVARHDASRRILVFGNAFLNVGPDKVRRKLVGLAVNSKGSLVWSRLYLEASPQQVLAFHSRPTDLAVDGKVVYVATETDDETKSKIGLFKIKASTGEFINMRLYRDPASNALYHPRIDAIAGTTQRVAMTFNDFAGSPSVALLDSAGSVLWANKITSAVKTAGIFRNSLLTNRLDTFVGEADRAGIVSFRLGTGAVVDQHYFATFPGDEDTVSMDRSQDERYILSLEQRTAASLLAQGLGYIYNDPARTGPNTFTLIYTGKSSTPFACKIDHKTSIEPLVLNKQHIDYANDDWAKSSDLEIGVTENTTLSETPCH